MKKLFYSLFALAMTAMTFTSCEDVPMPYDDPNKNPGGADTEEAVEPAGSGTAEDPYNVAAIVELVQGMEAGVETTEDLYFKGKISSITEEYSTQYGNATFYISDTGANGGTKFYVYRALYLGNKKFANGDEQIKIGDDVIVCGKVYNYNGSTPETVTGKAFLYSLNGKSAGGGGGSVTGIEVTCAKAVELTNALADNASSSEVYSVTGYITEVVGSVSKNQQTFWMADTKDGGKVFEAYWANLPEGVSEFKAGSKVKITGNLTKYVNANTGNVTAEMKNPVVEILEDGGGGGTPSSEVKVVTIAEFNAAAESSDVWYQLTGTVKNLKDGDQYGNFDLVDATGSVYVYGLLSEKGGEKKKFQDLVAAKGIKEGSTITIIGNRGSYNDKIEVMNAYFVSIGGGGGGTPSGDVKSVSIADFNAASESNDVWYQLKGKVTNLKDGDQYGNFDLVDATGSVYVYGLLSEKGGEKKKFQELVAAKGIKEGSTITIIGNRGSYNGKIEVMNAYFVSIDDQEGGGGGGQEQSGNYGTYEKPMSFADAQKADNSEKPWAWVKAVIVGYVNGKTYADGATFGADDCKVETNILIAGSASANNPDNCMPVQLPSGALRTGLNVMDHPELIGKEIIIYAQLDKYFSVPGLKSPKYAEAGGNSFGTKP